MELKDQIISSVNDAHRMVDIALQDLTPDAARFEPGGTANSIQQLLAHVTMGEDRAINAVLKGGQTIAEAEGWYARTGIPEGRGAFWQKDWRINLDAFIEYREKVKASANAYFEGMDVSVLDSEVEWGPSTRPASSLIQLVVVHHMLGHAGEMSVIRGIQGMKGLPF